MITLLEDILQDGNGDNALLVFRNDKGFHEVKGSLISVNGNGSYAVVPSNGSRSVEFTAADVRLFERREYFRMGCIIYLDIGQGKQHEPDPNAASSALHCYGS